MANRHTLHKSHVDPLKRFLESRGYQLLQLRTPYEAIRAISGFSYIIIYQKASADQHLTVRDVDMWIVKDFLRWYKEDAREKELDRQMSICGR